MAADELLKAAGIEVRRRGLSALVTLLMMIVGVLAGASMTWERQANRIAHLEADMRDMKPLLIRVDRALAGIEPMFRDYGRRLDRLENVR